MAALVLLGLLLCDGHGEGTGQASTLPPDTRIAAIFPDGPQRYFDTVYNDTFCRTHGLLDHAPAEQPDQISHPGERVVDRWTRCTTVTDPVTDPRLAHLVAPGASAALLGPRRG